MRTTFRRRRRALGPRSNSRSRSRRLHARCAYDLLSVIPRSGRLCILVLRCIRIAIVCVLPVMGFLRPSRFGHADVLNAALAETFSTFSPRRHGLGGSNIGLRDSAGRPCPLPRPRFQGLDEYVNISSSAESTGLGACWCIFGRGCAPSSRPYRPRLQVMSSPMSDGVLRNDCADGVVHAS